MNSTAIQWVENTRLGEKYAKVVHPSGLTVFVFPKKMSTSYALFATKYGSLDRTFKQGEEPFTTVPDGIAHFLEHKLFEEEDGSDVFAKFATLGANANAYTSNEMTAYLFSATENVKEALTVLLDFVTHPYFTEKNVQKEQGIIGQEIGMYDDNPHTRLYYALLEGLYKKHNVRINIAGTVETISHITPELLYRCYHTFYHPSNIALSVCGNITVEEVLEVVNAVIPADTQPIAISRSYPEEDAEIEREETVLKMAVATPLFAFGVKDLETFRTAEDKLRHAVCMDLLNDLMFADSSDFYNKLYDKGLISSFSAEYEWMDSCAFNVIIGESENPEAVWEELCAYLEEMQRKVPSKEDFERLKRSMYADYIRSFESTESIASEVLYNAFHGLDFLQIGEVILSVTYEDIVALAKSYYTDKHFARAIVLPND